MILAENALFVSSNLQDIEQRLDKHAGHIKLPQVLFPG